MEVLLSKLMAFVLSLLFAIGGLFGWAPPEVAPVTPEPEVERMAITADYVIVKPAQATETEALAAETLQRYLKQISGVELAIETDAGSYAKEILVGVTNREGTVYQLNRASLGDEGVAIQTQGDTVVITGGAQRGVLYAVYTFLENYLGCRWFSKDLTVVPQADSIQIPETIQYQHVPALEYRETDWISPRDLNYSVANKLNGLTYRYLPANVGGGVGYATWFAHSLQSMLSEADYAAQPDMRAFGIESKAYTTEHPCLSSESTYQFVLAKVMAALQANPEMQIVSVTHPDNQNYCVCDACKAVYEAEGSPSGLMLRFVNRIADAVKAAGYDNVKVDTFAYQYTRQAPKITRPRDNVIVRLCSIECCFAHALTDPECEKNTSFVKDINDWKQICETLYIWDYTTNYGNFNGPFNNWAVMQPNLKFFMENNVVGVYEEGNYQAAESNGEFAELRAYLLAKLLWDSEIDVHKAMVEFCQAYYGDAADYILQYLTLVTQKSGKTSFGRKDHLRIFDNVGNDGNMYLNLLDIHYIDGLWEKAKTADLTPEQLKRVRLSEISWRYWKSTKETGEFSLLTRYEANQKLYNDMKELGITRIHEGGENALLAEKPYFLDPPGRWSKDKVPDLIPGLFY